MWLIFGPVLVVAGWLGTFESTVDGATWLGPAILIAGIVFVVGGLFLTVRGYRRWRAYKAVEEAAFAEAEVRPVPSIHITGRPP